MPGALDGIRVIEVAQFVASPGAGAMLADWGAEVIHVEHPRRGDAYRSNLASRVAAGQSPASDINYIWELVNRGKKSLTLDLNDPKGRAVLHRLVGTADVFSSNLRPYELEKFRLDATGLAALNPRLVVANLTGYGSAGPDRDKPAFELAAFWARSGIMHSLGEPGQAPPASRNGMGDQVASMALASAMLLALLVRERLGIAQEVNVSLLHAGLWTLGQDVQSALMADKCYQSQQRPRQDARNPLVNHYQTKDRRWITLTLAQPDLYWSRFCRAIDREDMEQDPRFASTELLLKHNRELIAILDGVFACKTMGEWKDRLDAHGLIWSIVQTLGEVVHDAQAHANGCFTALDHPLGEIDLLASPVKMSRTPASIRRQAPQLGEHNEELLLELGYDWPAIIELRRRGIIS